MPASAGPRRPTARPDAASVVASSPAASASRVDVAATDHALWRGGATMSATVPGGLEKGDGAMARGGGRGTVSRRWRKGGRWGERVTGARRRTAGSSWHRATGVEGGRGWREKSSRPGCRAEGTTAARHPRGPGGEQRARWPGGEALGRLAGGCRPLGGDQRAKRAAESGNACMLACKHARVQPLLRCRDANVHPPPRDQRRLALGTGRPAGVLPVSQRCRELFAVGTTPSKPVEAALGGCRL